MPPAPRDVGGPSTAAPSSAPSATTVAPGTPGGWLITPSAEVSRNSLAARRRTATCAASTSLSPKLISSVAVASFSFRIGTAGTSKSALSALPTFRYERRSVISTGVRRTCATGSPSGANASCHTRCSSACPSAEAACNGPSFLRPLRSPAIAEPSAIAPDETITTGVPSRTVEATSAATPLTSSHRGRRSPSTTRFDPSLTTTGAFIAVACRRRSPETAAARGHDRSRGRVGRERRRR